MVGDRTDLLLTYTIVVLCRMLVLYKLYVTHASLNLLLLFVGLSLSPLLFRAARMLAADAEYAERGLDAE